MRPMAEPFFFGYGSLVNRATHGFVDAHPAQLTGWRRAWRHTSARAVAYLTAVPAPGAQIDGLIAHVPGDDWAALDERERAYARHPVTELTRHGVARDLHVQVYAIAPENHAAPDRQNPVLLSYIDVVVQGYLAEFGETGVQRFFDTTDGWQAPILDDRSDPVYPRHQRLSADERGLVHDQLARVGAQIVTEMPV